MLTVWLKNTVIVKEPSPRVIQLKESLPIKLVQPIHLIISQNMKFLENNVCIAYQNLSKMLNLWCALMSSKRKKLLLELPYSCVKEINNLTNSLKQRQWQLIFFMTCLFSFFSFIQELYVIFWKDPIYCIITSSHFFFQISSE